jgi:hypothetical protein
MTARPLATAGLFFAALYVAFFAVVIFRGQLLAPGDARIQSLAAFHSPPVLWTDLLLSGFPVAADPQVQSWYPPKLLFAAFGTWNAFVLSAYVLASLGVYGYVSTVTGVPWAALVSGIVFGMSGFMMAHLGHTMIIHATAWIPFIIWALERLRERLAGRWFVVGSAAVAALALAGHPQMLVYGLGLAGVYAMVMGWSLGARRWRYYGWCGGLGLLGVAASAIQLVPTVELARLSERHQLPFSEFVAYSLPLAQIPVLCFPHLFGGETGSPFLPYFGEWNITELTGYVGLLPLMLAVVGVVIGPRRRLTWFWIAVIPVAFVLALGDATPLARLMYHVPAYNQFRVPTRHFAEMTLAVSVLAGLGVASLLSLDRGRRTVPLCISMGGVAIVMALVFVAFADGVHSAAVRRGIPTVLTPWSNLAVGIPLTILGAATAALALWAWRPHTAWSRGLLLAVLCLDLASFGWFFEWRYSPSPETILRPSPDVARYARSLRDSHQRLLLIGEATNLTRLWGLPSASAYGPFVPLRMSRLLGIGSTGVVNAGSMADVNRTLDILAVRYVAIPTDRLVASSASALADARRWRRIETVGPVTVFENLRVQPRAWLVQEAVALSPGETIATLTTSRLPDGRTFDPARAALTERRVPGLGTGDPQPGTVEVLGASATAMRLRTRAPSARLVVLSDADYPGWMATIDGVKSRVVRVNYLLRGVVVPGGEHAVEVWFRPMSFWAGAAITAASLLALLIIGSRRRRAGGGG